MEGSSSTYITPVSPEPICEASRMRWASPPDRVSAERSRDRYCRPTSFRKRRRLAISRMIRSPTAALAPSSFRCSNQWAASPSVQALISQMGLSCPAGPTRTLRASMRRRVP